MIRLICAVWFHFNPMTRNCRTTIHHFSSLILFEQYLTNFAELVLGLLGGDPVYGESSLNVVDDPEVLSSLLNLDDIHEPSGELWIGSHLPINLDKTLLHNGGDLLHVQGKLQTVPVHKKLILQTKPS